MDWTSAQNLNKKNDTKNNNTIQIATRFEVYTKPQFNSGSKKTTLHNRIRGLFSIYEHVFDMNTGKRYDKDTNTFKNQKFILKK